jgi:hypothetical protein
MVVAGKKKRATDDADRWVSLSVAAANLAETRQTVLTRAIKGELEAKHVAGRTVVSRASVDRLLASRRRK